MSKIFIIDDDFEFAHALKLSCTQQGHDAIIYTRPEDEMNVPEAVGLWTEFHPDITFSDIIWKPKGDHGWLGWDFAQEIKGLRTDHRLVMMSGVLDEYGEELKLKAAGYEAEFITKDRLKKNPRAVLRGQYRSTSN